MKKKSETSSLTRVTAALVERNGKILIARRKPGGLFGGRWEFPGGKLKPRERPERGLERELAEELGVQARAEEYLRSFPYRGPDLAIELMLYKTFLLSGKLRLTDHDDVRWVDPASLDESAFADPDKPVVRWIRSLTRHQGPQEG